MQKKRGAPPGNQNAYKHGFYSAAFKAAEQRLLSELPAHDLTAEIELIRIGSLRLLQALDASGKPTDLATQLTALRILNLSAHSITSLLRTQAWAADARQSAADYEDYLRSTGRRPASLIEPSPDDDDPPES